jgi:hypothetical protein
MFVSAVGTIVAVGIMYVHSQGELGYRVPDWLITATLLNAPKQPKLDSPAMIKNNLNGSAPLVVRNEFVQMLRSIHVNVTAILQRHQNLEQKEREDELWMHVCYRLDMFALIVFNVFNFLLFLFYGILGDLELF